MDVYQTGRNGEFLGVLKADPDPRNPEGHIIPGGCVTVVPPAPQEGYARVWSEGKWSQVEDHRGEQGWVDGEPVKIAALGPLPADWTTEPPSAPEPPMPERIAARRFDAEVAGTTWNGWPVATDRQSQAVVGNAYKLAQDGYWQAGSVWKFADGVPRGLTPQQVMAMALAVAAHVQACFEVEAQKLAAHAAGESVDIEAGWGVA